MVPTCSPFAPDLGLGSGHVWIGLMDFLSLFHISYTNAIAEYVTYRSNKNSKAFCLRVPHFQDKRNDVSREKVNKSDRQRKAR